MEDFLKALKQHWLANDIPNITEENAAFIRKILKEKKVKKLLEIGTANGYSSITFMQEMQEFDWHITTIDFSKKSFDEAKENFEKAWVQDAITPLFWNALDILPQINEEFDFIFIDGMKRRTKDFLELTWNKLKNGWTIIIDDVIKFKDKMIWLYEYLEENNIEYEIIQIDADDGIMIIEKD